MDNHNNVSSWTSPRVIQNVYYFTFWIFSSQMDMLPLGLSIGLFMSYPYAKDITSSLLCHGDFGKCCLILFLALPWAWSFLRIFNGAEILCLFYLFVFIYSYFVWLSVFFKIAFAHLKFFVAFLCLSFSFVFSYNSSFSFNRFQYFNIVSSFQLH